MIGARAETVPVADGGVEGLGAEGLGIEVSVVLPCLNEAGSVGLCVAEALASFAAAGVVAEVVVVDNGSQDGSAEAAVRSGARVVNEAVRGYGSAIRAGIRAARGEVVVMADADCTYDLSRAAEVAAPVLRGESDLVLAAREGLSRRTMPFLHRFVGRPALAFLIARATGAPRRVRDSQSGYRAFARSTMMGLDLRSPGMELASEMLVRGMRAGLRITEVPTTYRPRVGVSKLQTFRDGWRHLRLILGLAPDLLLVAPGALLMMLGAFLSVYGLVEPAGTRLGSLRWQPVFFSTIALTVGTQALLAGVVLAHRLAGMGGVRMGRFRIVGHPRFHRRCVGAGTAVAGAGLLADGVLFVLWLTGQPAPSRGLALAGLAQSLLIVGATVATFGVIAYALAGPAQPPAGRNGEVGAAGHDREPLAAPTSS